MAPLAPAHVAGVSRPALPLLAVVVAAAAGSAALLGLALGALARRRSRPYLLVAGAFAALLGRSAVGALAVAGRLTPTAHHLLEHGLDVVLVALVVAAVYAGRGVREGEP